MDFGITAGDADKTIYVRLRDSTTGLAKTGLAYNSAGAVCSYVLPGAARAAITLATQTVTGAHADGGFVEVDATNCKGLYRLDLPDAAIASGAYSLISIEFDGVIEETIIVPLSLRKSDITAISGDSTAADNLEAAADGTGYNLGGGSVVAASVTGAVGSVTAGVTVTTNNDKTGYSLATAPPTAAEVRSEIDANSTQLTAILADTAEIGTAGAGLTEAGGTGDHLTAVPDSSGVTTLLSRIPSGIFTGITSMAQWLGLIAGKQTGNSTARTELRATGAGSGTYDETTDSLEAVRDRGDSAWETATGFSTHSASDVWDAATRTLTSAANITSTGGTTVPQTGDSYAVVNSGTHGNAAIKTETAAIKTKTDNLPASPAAVGSAMTLADSEDVYHADIVLTVDEANTQDEYTATWFRNGVRQTSGITSPQIQVVSRANGSDLIAATNMAQIGSTGSYKYDESTNRITAGEAVLVVVTATINSSSRSFSAVLSRDSTA